MKDRILLHHYDASPFSQKAIKMLAIKKACWESISQPMIAPKPDLTALTGGYRGTPVMQIGADIYVDSQLIAEELERRLPLPTLYPGGKGAAHMICDFADAYFRAGLDIAIKELSPKWDEPFYRDRDAVFPDLDFNKREERFPDACARLRGMARFLDEQLVDGRKYLTGDEPGLIDIQCYVVNWFTRAAFGFVDDLFSDFSRLKPWEARMSALGEGDRTEASAETAHAIAKNTRSVAIEMIDLKDPLGFSAGELVSVAPLSSARGQTTGRLIRLTADEVVVSPKNATIGTVAVHFPRLGYAIVRAG